MEFLWPSSTYVANLYILFVFIHCSLSFVYFVAMVKLESVFAFSALSMGVLAHPTIKHADRRFCALEETSVFGRKELTTRATIPKAHDLEPTLEHGNRAGPSKSRSRDGHELLLTFSFRSGSEL
jgi:hypothetical protein